MEGVLLTLLKPESATASGGEVFGEFLTLTSVCHSDFVSNRDTDSLPLNPVSMLPNDTSDFCNPGGDRDVEFLAETSHPVLYLQTRGHAALADLSWAVSGFPGGDGVVYYPIGTADEPTSSNQAVAGYRLVDISELWALRDDPTIFTCATPGDCGSFRGAPGDNASPPWGWRDHNVDGSLGTLFLDPAAWFVKAYSTTGAAPGAYVGRSYPMPP